MKKGVVALGVIGAFLAGCSVSEYQNVARGALSGDPTGAIKNIAINKSVRYASNPESLQRDIDSLSASFKQMLAVFVGEAAKEWGEDNVKEPSKKVYVKYTQNYKSRAEVDFDSGNIRVETVDNTNPKASLKQAIVTTILTPEDPRGVDLYSSKDVEFTGEPFLAGLVKDQDGKVVLYKWRAGRYADYLIKNRLKSDNIEVKGKTHKRYYVNFDMVKGKESVNTNKYASLVKKYAAANGVEESLVYAIIKTESSFNPYAVSSAPAYGLMQVVRSTAGRDVYRDMHGRDGMPTKDDLFDPNTNIAYGTRYLNILFNRYLKGVHNPVSREYCVISAYNGGAGNVFKTFSSSRTKALGHINSLDSNAVYWKLKSEHPFSESRNYLVKVTNSKKEFVRY
ncbi:MAG: murein transglycosylase domain-containing protein [Campylobacterales bacterium]